MSLLLSTALPVRCFNVPVQSLPALFQPVMPWEAALFPASVATSWVQPMGALAGGRGWEESEAGVFILLASWLQGCGLAVAVFLLGRTQILGVALCRSCSSATAVSGSQGRLSPSTHQAKAGHSSQLLLAPGGFATHCGCPQSCHI